MERDLSRELATTAAAGDDFARHLNDLGAFARARARPGPVNTGGRSFATETREELADAVNYLTWGEQAGELDTDQVAIALRHLALAWAAIT